MKNPDDSTIRAWALLVDALEVGVVITNDQGMIDYANLKAAALFKLDHDQLIGQPFGFPLNRDTKTEIEIIHADQSFTIAEIQVKLGFWLNKQSWVITLNDITERKQNEEQLKIAAGVFRSSHESIMITDINGMIIDVNQGFEQTFGYRKEEVLGENVNIIKSGKQSRDFYVKMFQQIKKKGCWHGEIWDRHKKGKVIPMILDISSVVNMNGDTVFYVGILHDISLLKKHENQLKYLALYDPLTRLPNLNLLDSEIDACLKQHKHTGHSFLLAYLDIDKFQNINLLSGTSYGDKALKHIANKLVQFVGRQGMVSRVSGDEFVILMRTLPRQQSCHTLVRNLLVMITRSMKIDKKRIKIACSIGYVLAPMEEGSSAGQIIRQAESAMFEAKIKGGNQVAEYNLDAVMEQKINHFMVKEIKKGLKAGEFTIFYQPKVQMNTGQVLGAEALLRWRHPTNGLCLPGFFLPYIETREEIRQLSSYVFSQVLDQLSQWLDQGIDMKVSINISALEIQHPNFIKQLRQKIGRYDHQLNHHLELELLETSAVKDIEQVSDLIRRCHQLGLTMSLDDFGTGYSSLSYLKRLNVDTVKIDQGFVNEVLINPKAIAILDSIIFLSDKFGQSLVAEGVDSLEKGLLLLRLGCEQGQGFFIGEPMPPDEFIEWRQSWKAPEVWLRQKKIEGKFKDLIYARAMLMTLKNSLLQHKTALFWQHFDENQYFGTLNLWSKKTEGQGHDQISQALMETKNLIQSHIETLGRPGMSPAQRKHCLKELSGAIALLLRQIDSVLEQ